MFIVFMQNFFQSLVQNCYWDKVDIKNSALGFIQFLIRFEMKIHKLFFEKLIEMRVWITNSNSLNSTEISESFESFEKFIFSAQKLN